MSTNIPPPSDTSNKLGEKKKKTLEEKKASYKLKQQQAQHKREHHEAMRNATSDEREKAMHNDHANDYHNKEKMWEESARTGVKNHSEQHKIKLSRANKKEAHYQQLVKTTEDHLAKLNAENPRNHEEIKRLEHNLKDYKALAGYHGEKYKRMNNLKVENVNDRKKMKADNLAKKKEVQGNVSAQSHHTKASERDAHFVCHAQAQAVKVTGNWVHFKKEHGVMMNHEAGEWKKTVRVPMPHIEYKFLIQHKAGDSFAWEHDGPNRVMDLTKEPSPHAVKARSERTLQKHDNVKSINKDSLHHPSERKFRLKLAGLIRLSLHFDQEARRSGTAHLERSQRQVCAGNKKWQRCLCETLLSQRRWSQNGGSASTWWWVHHHRVHHLRKTALAPTFRCASSRRQGRVSKRRWKSPADSPHSR